MDPERSKAFREALGLAGPGIPILLFEDGYVIRFIERRASELVFTDLEKVRPGWLAD